MKQDFRYTLRLCLDPRKDRKEQLDSLEEFVQQASIDDVSFFIASQDINTGHITLEEQDEYLEMLREMQAMLSQYNVTISINHWVSLLLGDIGQPLKEGQEFRRMVDVNGYEAEACICPTCKNWLAYYIEILKRYAALSPEIIWIDDDLRYHNHLPLEWGGCFCDYHMELYSQKAGKPLEREEFITKLLQPGEPHPYRQIWLDTCREVLEEVAEALGNAVRSVSSTTKVGLMTSAPYVHSAEGRNRKALLGKLAAGGPSVDRVHLTAYNEVAPKEYLRTFNMVARQSRFFAKDAEIYPELENFPYSRFSNSHRFTRYQMLLSLPLDEDGLAITLFDLNGNGILPEEGYQKVLTSTKPYLEELNRREIFSQPARGVKIMCNEVASATLHTPEGSSMEELYPQEIFFAGLFPSMGIPYSYCDTPEVKDSVLAVSGQYFRSLSKEQIQTMFAHNFVIVNGDALEVLKELDLLSLLSIQEVKWEEQDSGVFTFEQGVSPAVDEDFVGSRASTMIFDYGVMNATYSTKEKIQELSVFCNAERQPAFPGHVVIDHQGFVYPFGQFDWPTEVPLMLLNPRRQAMLQYGVQQGISSHDKEGFPLILNTPHLAPYVYKKGDTWYVYLVNGSMDDISKVTLWVPQPPKSDTVMFFPWDGVEEVVWNQYNEQQLEIECLIPAMEAGLLRWEVETEQ